MTKNVNKVGVGRVGSDTVEALASSRVGGNRSGIAIPPWVGFKSRRRVNLSSMLPVLFSNTWLLSTKLRRKQGLSLKPRT